MPHSKTALLEWKQHQKEMRYKKKIDPNDSKLVFSHIDGSPIKCFNRAWWTALEKAEIKNFHFHDLRHTFCSNLLLSGAGLKEVKEMIGHSDVGMTDRYAHLTNLHMHQQQKRLSEYYTDNSV